VPAASASVFRVEAPQLAAPLTLAEAGLLLPRCKALSLGIRAGCATVPRESPLVPAMVRSCRPGLPVENARSGRQGFLIPTSIVAGRVCSVIVEHHAVHALDILDKSGSRSAPAGP